MLSLRAIEFGYPDQPPLFAGLNLEIPAGALFGLLGPNGAGKTTLISLMTGQRRPAKGELTILGRSYFQHRRQILSRLAFVPQDYAFYPQLTVPENLGFFASLYPGSKPERARRMQEALELAGLQGHLKRPAKQFSGGLKRRLNLAIGLLNRPQILFLDEPTVGIDPQSRHFILQAIKALNLAGVTIIYTSHYMEEVEQICDRVAIIDHGRILAQDSMAAILRKPASLQIELDPGSRPERLPDGLGQLLEAFGLGYHHGVIQGMPRTPADIRRLMERLEAERLTIRKLAYGQQNLESLFFELTQTQLRD
jgi:ABC-2 type transport system ATP-binding protein